MKKTLLALLCFFAFATANADDPFVSRYNGPSYDKTKMGDCQAKAAEIAATLKSLDLGVLSANCVEGAFGSVSVVIDYAHPFGKDIDRDEFEYPSPEACAASLKSLTDAMDKAGLTTVSAFCQKNYGRGIAKVDYVRGGKNILHTLDRQPIFDTADACEDVREGLLEAFSKNAIYPLLSECIQVLSGMTDKKWMLRGTYAIELGRGVHFLRGKQVSDCDDQLKTIAAKFIDNKLPLLTHFCEKYGSYNYQTLIYVSGIYTKVRDYAGILFQSESACLASLKEAGAALEKAKKTLLFGYCNVREKAWMDPSTGVRPFIHYVDPPIVLDPTPVPDPVPFNGDL